MKAAICLLWAGVLLCASAAQGVTVDGYARVLGQEFGVWVYFNAASPSASTDSVRSNWSSGYYSIQLQPGVYDVEYYLPTYAPFWMRGQVLLFDTTLPPVELYEALSGALSGEVGIGWFQVVDSISVEEGQALTIFPATRLLFEPRAKFAVRGRLNAVGAAGTDSIFFTARYTDPDSGWGGIRLENADDSSRMEYCVVEWARKFHPDSGYVAPWYCGGIYIMNCSPAIQHSSIRYNYTEVDGGGGIACRGGQPYIADCENSFNSADDANGGGIYCGTNCGARFERCLIRGNRTEQGCGGGVFIGWSAHPQFIDCEIVANYGIGGIYLVEDFTASFFRCTISGNIGGGIMAAYGSHAIFQECLITDNTGNWGSGLFCNHGAPRIERCTFVGNGADTGSEAIILFASSAEITSTVIVSAQGEGGFYLQDSPYASIRYCDVFGNREEPFSYLNNDPANGPPHLGIVALTNANGDSCDTYYNIFMDPQFADTAAGDYGLTEGSPCIDAGDPSLELDPDGTVADMGAFYYDQLDAPEPNRTAVRGYELWQNYPNPFNAQSRIRFELPQASEVKLEVFDITGRQVRTLASGMMQAGLHEVNFDAGDLPSGVYIYRLQASEHIEARKMILLR